jgi:dimethylamine monooxygenase subunit A
VSARYVPWSRGVYDVSPSLRPFGTEFGNGEWDQRLFQLDADAPRLIEAKRLALRERRGKYVRAFRLGSEVERAVAGLIAARLATEYPDEFSRGSGGDDPTLRRGDVEWTLAARGDGASLDLLARLVPEDLAVVRTEEGRDWNAYLHVCAPARWAAEDKIGRSFFDTHVPVPGFDRANAAAAGLVRSMVERGPWVRFVWTPETDDRPNHHPEPPPGEDPELWSGRRFEDGGPWWVRVERQSLWPLPQAAAALFVIRTHWVGADTLTEDERRSLGAALRSMSTASRAYKGLGDPARFDALLRRIDLERG